MKQNSRKGVTEFVKLITNKENFSKTKGVIKHAVHEEETNLLYCKTKLN